MKKYSRKLGRQSRRQGLKLIARRPLLGFLLIAAAIIFHYWPRPSSGEITTEPGDGKQASLFGRVSRVADGDSIEIKEAGRVTRVRLYGVDAPELNQKHGPEARDWLADQILNQKVRVEVMDIDQYDRVVGLVFLNEAPVNQTLVASGQAWVYGRYCSIGLCRQMKKDEKEARLKRLGLWRQDDPDPPWSWRRTHPSRP